MKKTFLLTLICHFIVMNSLDAQIVENGFVAETNFNYSQAKRESLNQYYSFTGEASSYRTESKSNNLLLAINAGYSITKNFVFGVSYQHKNSQIKTIAVIPISGIPGSEETYTSTSLSKTREIIPGVFIRKYFQLIDKLYFVSNLNFSYHMHTNQQEMDIKSSLNNTYNAYTEHSFYTQDFNNLSLNLSTSLLFRFKDKLGIQLKFAQVNYQFNDSRESIELIDYTFPLNGSNPTVIKRPAEISVNINPVNWEYGLVLFF